MHNGSLLLAGMIAAAVVAACGGGGGGTPDPKTPEKKATTAIGTPPIRGTTFTEDLKGIGFDVKTLPKFGELTKAQKKSLMPLFAKSVGMSCAGCHAGGGETPNMRIAKKMWDQWVVGFQITGEGGGAVFCDSCHQGKKEFLDRSQHEALSLWMENNFVNRHQSATTKGTDCARCHGDPFVSEFLTAWKN